MSSVTSPHTQRGTRRERLFCRLLSGAKTLLRHIRFCLKTEMRFFSVFKKINPRLHVAFFNRFCSWTRKRHSDWQQYQLIGACPYNGHSVRDDIFLKSLRFQPSTRKLQHDDGDGTENGKKPIGLSLQNNNSLHVQHTFLYKVSLPSLYDCEVKFPQVKFYGGRKHKTTNFSFSL